MRQERRRRSRPGDDEVVDEPKKDDKDKISDGVASVRCRVHYTISTSANG